MYSEVDYYAVLGVSRDATTAEIRKAYKMLALSHHPDKVPQEQREEAEAKFKEISEAYEILSDETERSGYDTFGAGDPNGDFYSRRYENGSRDYSAEDFARFFGFDGAEFTNGNGHSSGGVPNGRPAGDGGGPGVRRTEDATIPVSVTLEDIYKGKTVKMNSERDVLCKHCSGTGARKSRYTTCKTCGGAGYTRMRSMYGTQIHQCKDCKGRGIIVKEKDRCRKCTGKGTILETSILEVYLPRGVPNNYVVSLKGKADEAYGRQTGDINFVVEVQDHAVFTRRDSDLLAKVTITLAEALTGFSRILLQHLDERGIKIMVPQGTVTKPGQHIKVVGDGLPVPNMDISGDLYLEVQVEFPPSGWCLEVGDLQKISHILPDKPRTPLNILPKEVDEVDYLTVDTLPDKFSYPEGYEEEIPDQDGSYRPNECAQM